MNFLRTDTEKEHRTDLIVDETRQQFIGVLGMRGEGKSYIVDTEAELAFLMGYTILDLHGADNLENAFWIFKSDDPEVKNPIKIPITLIAQDTLLFDQKRLDHFNSEIQSEEDYLKQNPGKYYDYVYPPRIPFKKPMIKVEIIPRVTSSKAEYETESNQKALDKLVEIILDCRKNRRIFVLNRVMFASERQYFWTMELIIRNLGSIAEKYFKRLEPKNVGLPEYIQIRGKNGLPKFIKTPRSMMTKTQRNHHRIMIVTRELGELCPSRSLKGDKTGESLSVKKAFFNFIKKARHQQIDWIADWQRNNDVEDAIRSQCDKWIIKRYNDDLGGEDKKQFFDKLNTIREAVFEKYGRVAGKFIATSNYPDISKLDPHYHYLWIHGMIHLRRVRKCRHLHKEPYHRFEDFTGIEFTHDLTKVKEDSKQIGKSKTSEQNICNLYRIVRDFKDPLKQKKPLSNSDILKNLAPMQQKGLVTFHLDFSKMSPRALSTYYGRWKDVFERSTSENSSVQQ